jgi:conserved oligomeric Golgi complex subunit 4
MDRDYTGIIKKKLDDVYRSTGNAGVATRGEKAERDNRNTFLVRLTGF